MPLKSSAPSSEVREVDRWAHGVGWLAHPEETMRRASHAVETDGDVWVVDPLDGPGVDDLLADLGTVVGVVVLLDRHARDCATFARRHDVPVYVPPFVDVDLPDDVAVVRAADGLPDTDYAFLETVNLPGWHEAALADGDTLVVGDAVGTAAYFTADGARLGVHPFLRLVPPSALRDRDPDRVLVGHGAGVTDRAGDALADALANARARAPQVWVNALKGLL